MSERILPDRLGPYRLEGSLGAGGMGEVYSAWDERLERRVAIKLIRPEAAGKERARARLRREARAAAALSHPGIVAIHDLLTWGDAEVLVLEHVQGTSLDRLLERGPLPVAATIRLGAEVAAALAAAHQAGILHRDLKPGNVMLTEQGHAKVLDFGIAKRLDSGLPDPALSADGVLVGTPQAMSPEQARGLPLDERSDLFALGSLLYEAACGLHPFKVPSALDTLSRVLTAHPTPLAERLPTIPAELSALVERLLEKEPARRPGSAREVERALLRLEAVEGTVKPGPPTQADTLVDSPRAGIAPPEPPTRAAGRRPWARLSVAAVLALAALGGWLLLPRQPGPIVVAVPRPKSASGLEDATRREQAYGLRTAVLHGLLGLRGIDLPAPEQVDAVTGSAVELARALAADEVLATELDCTAALCRISLARIAGSTGALLWTESFTAPANQPQLLADAVRGYLRGAYHDREPRAGFESLAVRPEDYRAFLELASAFDQRGAIPLPVDDFLARLRALSRTSPRFPAALVLEAQLLRHRFGIHRDPADLDRAGLLLAAARKLSASDPRPLLVRFEIELTRGDLAAAARALDELQRLQPGEPGLLARQARLLESQGSSAEALAAMGRAAELQPSWPNLFRLADMQYRLGQTNAAKRSLGELLERFPGSTFGRSLLAQIELLAGRADTAATLYQELVAGGGGVGDRVNLSIARLLEGRYGEARVSAEEALKLEPDHPWATLSLADATLLAGDGATAASVYRRLLELAERDPATATWPLASLKAQALAHLEQRHEALAVLQPVAAAGRDNPQAAYEACLVYTLVGDTGSALTYAELALKGGVAPAWFRLPWFEGLAASPRLQPLLAASRTEPTADPR